MTCREFTAHACMECAAVVAGFCTACLREEGVPAQDSGCSACGAQPDDNPNLSTGPLCCCSGCVRDATDPDLRDVFWPEDAADRRGVDLTEPEHHESDLFGSDPDAAGSAYSHEGRELGSGN